MEFTFKRTTGIVAALLLIAAITQAIYTGLYIAKMDVPRQLLWGSEGVLFTILAAFAGSALAQAKRFHLALAAITAAAILNVVQVGVGLTLFGPFREAASAVPEMAPAASGIVAFSFMVYNAAKVLLALALLAVGLVKLEEGGKLLGGASVLTALVAVVSNAVVMYGLQYSITSEGGFMPAGGSGVVATVLLAVCLFSISGE
ncbi:MAG: thiamine biosynthesis protein ThiC [Pseudomonadota bacterium]